MLELDRSISIHFVIPSVRIFNMTSRLWVDQVQTDTCENFDRSELSSLLYWKKPQNLERLVFTNPIVQKFYSIIHQKIDRFSQRFPQKTQKTRQFQKRQFQNQLKIFTEPILDQNLPTQKALFQLLDNSLVNFFLESFLQPNHLYSSPFIAIFHSFLIPKFCGLYRNL